jgi:hypothetical protein
MGHGLLGVGAFCQQRKDPQIIPGPKRLKTFLPDYQDVIGNRETLNQGSVPTLPQDRIVLAFNQRTNAPTNCLCMQPNSP